MKLTSDTSMILLECSDVQIMNATYLRTSVVTTFLELKSNFVLPREKMFPVCSFFN